jgi:16S rRNA (adenine1518-N6/adenine1519-N6)-dimethyltransferase
MNAYKNLKNIPDPVQTLKTDLEICGIKPNRLKGQNYLISSRVRDYIANVAKLEATDSVIEIGPGTGVLTWALAARAGDILAVEREESMARLLQNRFNSLGYVTIIHDDGLQVMKNLAEQPHHQARKIISNLPYSISAPLLKTMAACHMFFPGGVLLLQREVVDRVAAKPGDTERGALSVIVQARFNATRVLNVKSTHFRPVPAVDSAVLVLEPAHHDIPIPWNAFVKTVFEMFAYRRKTLFNNAKKAVGSVMAETLLAAAGIDPEARAQQLSIEQFIRYADLKYQAVRE